MKPADEARRRGRLSDEQRARLSAGEHASLARELEHTDPELSAWIHEQVWDFAAAAAGYRAADRPLDTLRVALEHGGAALLEDTLVWLQDAGPETVEAARALLEKRGLHEAAARLLAAAASDPATQAEALRKAGDPSAAARVLLAADRPREALDQLGELRETPAAGDAWALAARCWWALGDAHAAARSAQAARRCGVRETPEDESEGPLSTLLAAALEALGHADAAGVVLGQQGEAHHAQGSQNQTTGAGLSEQQAQDRARARGGHGRYVVQAVHPTPLAGAAYLAIDRVTHQEVELHLLLADQHEQHGTPDPEALEAVMRFMTRAGRVAKQSHPALRPILRVEERAGLLVLPRADGPSLRAMIRPPGVLEHPARARAMIRFLLEGLDAVHKLGVAHGGVLPHMITTDVLGRPILGPAGADALSGLAATRTGGLEELLSLSAPELHRGGAATPASDIFSAGRIWAALLLGRLKFDLNQLPEPARGIIERMTHVDPAMRPQAKVLAHSLATPVADFRVLGSAIRPGESGVSMQMSEALDEAVSIAVAPRWTDEELAELCEHATPWMQTIVQRDGRQLWLAPWPFGCATLDPNVPTDSKLHPRALEGLSDALAQKIKSRLTATMLVRTPAEDWFVALDGLLT